MCGCDVGAYTPVLLYAAGFSMPQARMQMIMDVLKPALIVCEANHLQAARERPQLRRFARSRRFFLCG